MTSPEALFLHVAERPGAVWLDSGDGEGWSIVAWEPTDVADGWPARRRAPRRAEAPFDGGHIGYVGYGAGHRVAPVPRGAPTPEPEIWLPRYEGAACFRHADATWHLTGPPSLQRDAARALAEATAPPPPAPPTGRVRASADRAPYERAVDQIRALITEGDCYQVNLTRAVHVDEPGDPVSAYRRLRERPAPYGAILRVSPEVAVLSNSPELLLAVDGARVVSVPIKGTRPRGAEPAADRALAEALLASDKDRAELTMIVDLVRNDLGRVARIGSVRAGERSLASLPTVHHTVWPVEAELAEGRDGWDALAALFPPGSVTGAPKIRACQRIAELEGEPRGAYCGAIGYASDDGRACWSVAIRVAVFAGGAARYHVGGGIVIDSAPADEWAETVAKEAALRRALVR